MALSGVLDSVVGRAVRDAVFREKLLSQPLETAVEAGYELSSEDREQLATLDVGKAASFFQSMDAQDVPMAWCTQHRCYQVEKESSLIRRRTIVRR